MAKRATVYFEEPIHKALRLKAAETDTSVSEYVNDAVKRALAEDEEDLAGLAGRLRDAAIFANFLLIRAAAEQSDRRILSRTAPSASRI